MSRKGYPENLHLRSGACEHAWNYGGVRYRVGRQLAGSSAHEVEYFDCYYCSKCLARNYSKLELTHDSYQRTRHAATPMPEGAGPR